MTALISVPSGRVTRRPALDQNPIRAAVAVMRAERPLTPRQRQIRDEHLAEVEALVASGVFSLRPRR